MLERLYGRHKGRPLNARKSALMRDLLPRMEIRAVENMEVSELFGFAPDDLWLEVGFGGGEHLAAQAANHPSTAFIGCEPFVNGVAGLLDHVDSRSLGNVRIFAGDARVLLDALPEASVGRCFVLFPDPWPKKRHIERRFVGGRNLDRLARAIRPDGELRLATDVAALADWMRAQMSSHPLFAQIYNGTEPPSDWTPTRYEQKGRAAGRIPEYFGYRRVAAAS